MVNYAARLVSCNPRGEEGIYLSSAAQRDIRNEYGPKPDTFRVVPLRGCKPMKGFSTPETVYEVMSPGIQEARVLRRRREAPAVAPTNAPTPPELKRPDPPRWSIRRAISFPTPDLKRPDDK